MTRDQLIEKRRIKKRNRKLKQVGMVGGAAVVLLLLFFIVLPRVSAVNRVEVDSEEETLATDTALTMAAAENMAGETGWNVADEGWYFLNADGTVYASGWKTLDGQRYYFTDEGYMATGWVNTGEARDYYFSDSGMVDTSVQQKLIALTFDDGPSNNTGAILDVLEEYDSKATFFVVGQQAEYYTDELQREQAMGMEIGSHTYEHLTLKYKEADEIRETMERNDEAIMALIGEVPAIMRPTGGGVDYNVATNVDKPMINWDVDTLDWSTKDAQSTYDAIMNNAKDGSIVLMHDLYEATAEAVKMAVPDLISQGYKLVTVTELAEAYGYTPLEDGALYYDFYPTPSGENMSHEELLASFETE